MTKRQSCGWSVRLGSWLSKAVYVRCRTRSDEKSILQCSSVCNKLPSLRSAGTYILARRLMASLPRLTFPLLHDLHTVQILTLFVGGSMTDFELRLLVEERILAEWQMPPIHARVEEKRQTQTHKLNTLNEQHASRIDVICFNMWAHVIEM